MPEDQDPNEPEGVRQLREALEREKARNEDGAAAIRELNMLKAGVDTTSPTGQYFLETYSGDLDPEAIKAKASEIGVLLQAPPAEGAPDTNPVDPGDLLPPGAAQQSAGLAGDGAPPEQVPSQDQVEVMYQQYRTDLSNGVSEETAGCDLIQRIMVQGYGHKNPAFLVGPDGQPMG